MPQTPKPAAFTIALVDDYSQMRQFIARYLSQQGFDVVCQADNGADFLRQLLQMEAAPDLCLLDLHMPEMDGFETASRLKAYYPHIRILAFSSCDFQDEINRALQCGAHGFCSKGNSPAEVKAALLAIMLVTTVVAQSINLPCLVGAS